MIKRYVMLDGPAEMGEDDYGDYVTFEDYEKLEKVLDEIKKLHDDKDNDEIDRDIGVFEILKKKIRGIFGEH